MKKVYILEQNIQTPNLFVPKGTEMTLEGEFYRNDNFNVYLPIKDVENNSEWFKISYQCQDYDFVKWCIKENFINEADVNHLRWVFGRLRFTYHVEAHQDWMIKFLSIISKLEKRFK